MNMGKRILAILFGMIAFSIAADAARPALKRAEEYFRRGDYARAGTAAAADTSSTDRASRAAALFMLARIETDYAKAERLLRRVMESDDAIAADRARLELSTMRYATGDYTGAL
jgi:hypothetical protein